MASASSNYADNLAGHSSLLGGKVVDRCAFTNSVRELLEPQPEEHCSLNGGEQAIELLPLRRNCPILMLQLLKLVSGGNNYRCDNVVDD